jgi:hypothetical protein
MIVIEQRLTPGVQHGGDADLRLELVVGELNERGAGRFKKQLVKRPPVLSDQAIERVGQSKDDMEVGHRQERSTLLLEPLEGLGLLATGAVPIAAAMRDKMILAAVLAAVKMASEFRTMTTEQRSDRLPVMSRQTVRGGSGSRQRGPQHIGKLQTRAATPRRLAAAEGHRIGSSKCASDLRGRVAQQIERTPYLCQPLAAHMQVVGRSGETAMPQQHFQHRDLHP